MREPLVRDKYWFIGMRFNRIKLFLLVSVITAVSLTGLHYFWLVPKYTVPILMYHEIGYEGGSFSVTPENFAKQMEYLKDGGYDVISLNQLVEGIKSGRVFKRNKVVITFDDGYENNFKYAYPVLKKMKFPATIFIISGFMDKAPKEGEKEFLRWAEVKEMSENGISFGSHTASHIYLGDVTDENAAAGEIAGSKKMIEEKIGSNAGYFCYPSGGFNDMVKAMVKSAGYKGACTTNRGFVDFNRDVYELKRVKVTNSDLNRPVSFWIKLSGYYNILRKEKHPHR